VHVEAWTSDPSEYFSQSAVVNRSAQFFSSGDSAGSLDEGVGRGVGEGVGDSVGEGVGEGVGGEGVGESVGVQQSSHPSTFSHTHGSASSRELVPRKCISSLMKFSQLAPQPSVGEGVGEGVGRSVGEGVGDSVGEGVGERGRRRRCR